MDVPTNSDESLEVPTNPEADEIMRDPPTNQVNVYINT